MGYFVKKSGSPEKVGLHTASGAYKGHVCLQVVEMDRELLKSGASLLNN